MTAIVRERRSRKYRQCVTRAYEAGCHRSIEVGEWYVTVSFPPGADPLNLPGWYRYAECIRCARWHDRALP